MWLMICMSLTSFPAWYADRGGQMFSLEGRVVGHCVVNMKTDKQCDVTAGVVRYQSLLECTQTA